MHAHTRGDIHISNFVLVCLQKNFTFLKADKIPNTYLPNLILLQFDINVHLSLQARKPVHWRCYFFCGTSKNQKRTYQWQGGYHSVRDAEGGSSNRFI